MIRIIISVTDVKGLTLVVIIALAVTAFLFQMYSEDIGNMQQDFQAYSRRSLLPDSEKPGDDLGE